MKSLKTKIIILDDDHFDNTLSMLLFKRLLRNIQFDICGFTDPREGLHFIATDFCLCPVPTILLLDISMPFLNGWEVLHQLERLPLQITKHLTVFILSNSIAGEDVQKSEVSPLVKAYLAKPLTDHLTYLFASILETELLAIDKGEISVRYK